MMFLFVQQSQTQNRPALRFSLLASGQGLTAISEGGEIHFFRQIHATRQVIGGRIQVKSRKSKGKSKESATVLDRKFRVRTDRPSRRGSACETKPISEGASSGEPTLPAQRLTAALQTRGRTCRAKQSQLSPDVRKWARTGRVGRPTLRISCAKQGQFAGRPGRGKCLAEKGQ